MWVLSLYILMNFLSFHPNTSNTYSTCRYRGLSSTLFSNSQIRLWKHVNSAFLYPCCDSPRFLLEFQLSCNCCILNGDNIKIQINSWIRHWKHLYSAILYPHRDSPRFLLEFQLSCSCWVRPSEKYVLPMFLQWSAHWAEISKQESWTGLASLIGFFSLYLPFAKLCRGWVCVLPVLDWVFR